MFYAAGPVYTVYILYTRSGACSIYMYMRYKCYHSYVKDYQYESLACLVERLGGWVEPCLVGLYIFVPESKELFVILYDSNLIRRSTLDYVVD